MSHFIPKAIFIVILVWQLIRSFRKRKVAYGRTFTRILYCELDRDPIAFYAIILLILFVLYKVVVAPF